MVRAFWRCLALIDLRFMSSRSAARPASLHTCVNSAPIKTHSQHNTTHMHFEHIELPAKLLDYFEDEIMKATSINLSHATPSICACCTTPDGGLAMDRT